MKCKYLSQFDNYFNEFQARLFKLKYCMDDKWKDMFLVSLRSWLFQKLLPIFFYPIQSYPFGVIQQGVHATIAYACREMKTSKQAANPSKSGMFKSLCKQMHIYEDFSSKKTKKHENYRASPKKNLGGWET